MKRRVGLEDGHNEEPMSALQRKGGGERWEKQPMKRRTSRRTCAVENQQSLRKEKVGLTSDDQPIDGNLGLEGQTSSPIREEVIDLRQLPKTGSQEGGMEFQERKRGGVGNWKDLLNSAALKAKRSPSPEAGVAPPSQCCHGLPTVSLSSPPGPLHRAPPPPPPPPPPPVCSTASVLRGFCSL